MYSYIIFWLENWNLVSGTGISLVCKGEGNRERFDIWHNVRINDFIWFTNIFITLYSMAILHQSEIYYEGLRLILEK